MPSRYSDEDVLNYCANNAPYNQQMALMDEGSKPLIEDDGSYKKVYIRLGLLKDHKL